MEVYMYAKEPRSDSYEMFSEAGNKACDEAVKEIERTIEKDLAHGLTEDQVTDMLRQASRKISESHSEVGDTEPRWHMRHNINLALHDNGYDFTI